MMRELRVAAVAASILVLGTGYAMAESDVRLGYAVQVHQANMMLLEEATEAHGVDIEMTPLRRYADLQLGLMTDQLDMVVVGYPNLGLMEDKGFSDYTAVAGVFNGAQSLTLAPNVTAADWTDLEGLKIGSAPNSTAELLFKASMIANGADPSKVEFVSFTAGGPPLLAALKAGDIQGFVSWEPNNADAVISGAGQYSSLNIAANATEGVNGVLVVRNDFLAANEDVVAKVVASLVEVTDRLNADEELYVQTAVEGTGANAEVVRLAIPRGTLSYALPTEQAKAMLDLIASAGITSRSFSDVVDARFEPRFVEEAVAAK
jgi:ABC-type nitrate/sulfonate/bicarbonate transport system substrate-binding protein